MTTPVDLGRAPASDDERLLFAHLYETLITIDCEGRPRAALAASWRGDEDGAHWTFTLRPNARLGNEPLTAAAVLAAWGDAATMLDPAAISAEGDDRIVLAYATRGHSLPVTLAAPALAVRRPAAGGGWPEGTVPAETAREDGRDVVTIRPAHGRERRFILAPGADGRDLVDRGVDVLRTEDPQVIEYAARRAELTALPLPWTTVYVAQLTGWRGPNLIGERVALARDAVRVDARAATEAYWFQQAGVCGEPARRDGEGAGDSEIVAYPAEDRTAELLAERLMVLSTRPLTAAGVPARLFASRVAAGVDAVSLVPVPIRSFTPCDVMASVRWSRVVPLVETRAHLVMRLGVASVITDWVGTPRIR
ncbi:MAG TPA: hypothetical protein VGA37_12500 [Gemmatimonadales bacterium]